MALYLWDALQLDRVGMTAPHLSKGEGSFLFGQMQWFAFEGKTLLPGWKMTLQPKQYRTVLSFYPPFAARKAADIVLGSTKQFTYMTMTVYPGRFVTGDFGDYQSATSLLLDRFAYNRMYIEQKVSYIEVAIDSRTVPRESIIPMKPGTKTSAVWENIDASMGQVTLGSVMSPNRFRIYDKKRQLAETLGKLVPSLVLTRIEAIKRYTGLRGFELQMLPNLFDELILITIEDAMAQSSSPEWMAFLADAITYGVATALAVRHPKSRKLFREQLKAAAASWWNPVQRWKGYVPALAAIRPLDLQ